MEVRYTEGPDALDVPLPEGGEQRVERGEWVDLPRELVVGDGGLLRQGWESRAAKKAAQTRKAADDAADQVEEPPTEDTAPAVEGSES